MPIKRDLNHSSAGLPVSLDHVFARDSAIFATVNACLGVMSETLRNAFFKDSASVISWTGSESLGATEELPELDGSVGATVNSVLGCVRWLCGCKESFRPDGWTSSFPGWARDIPS